MSNTILYRVYDRDDNFVGVWKDVIKDIEIDQTINKVAVVANVQLARNFNNRVTEFDQLVDNTLDPIEVSA